MDLREQLQATLSGSYTLERELGGGGMSRVFVAEELHAADGWRLGSQRTEAHGGLSLPYADCRPAFEDRIPLSL
jgi:hypothetical protein